MALIQLAHTLDVFRCGSAFCSVTVRLCGLLPCLLLVEILVMHLEGLRKRRVTKRTDRLLISLR